MKRIASKRMGGGGSSRPPTPCGSQREIDDEYGRGPHRAGHWAPVRSGLPQKNLFIILKYELFEQKYSWSWSARAHAFWGPRDGTQPVTAGIPPALPVTGSRELRSCPGGLGLGRIWDEFRAHSFRVEKGRVASS